ncbi:MAG: peptidylprolyl isomerase [Planctomycetota bacterium]
MSERSARLAKVLTAPALLSALLAALSACAGQSQPTPVLDDVTAPMVEAMVAGLEGQSEQAPPAGVAASTGAGPFGDLLITALPTPSEVAELARLVAELDTTHGLLVLEFDPAAAPRHVAAFVERARAGLYDGLSFHRVLPGVLAQTGDPVSAGRERLDEVLPLEAGAAKLTRGTLAMARLAHPDSAGSQFFLALGDLPWLDGKYTVFGRLLRGESTLLTISELGSETGATREPVLIRKLIIRPRTAQDVRHAGQSTPENP